MESVIKIINNYINESDSVSKLKKVTIITKGEPSEESLYRLAKLIIDTYNKKNIENN